MDNMIPSRPFRILQKIFIGVAAFGVSESALADGTTAPLTYTTNNGARQSVELVTSVGANGGAVAPAYKGNDGQWHNATVVAQICGVTSTGAPQLCPPSTGTGGMSPSLIGQALGVAGLDSQTNVYEGVNTLQNISTQAAFSQGTQATIPLQLNGNGWQGDVMSHQGGPRVTIGTPIPFMADNMALFGGHRLYDSVFSKFYALPYGVGDDGGCVHSSVMSGSPLGGANCGAGGWDAVDEYEFAGNQMPWYVTGQDFPDENGVVHTVTFTANGATVRPALPDSYLAQMHGNMHVMTNITAGPTIYSGVQLLDPDPTHRDPNQQIYGNTLSGWKDGSDATGSFTQFTMSGQWEPLSGGNVDNGHAPAVGSVNRAASGGKDSLEQSLYGEFTHPFIEFGTYYKAFTRNTTCSIIARNDVDQGTNMRRLGPARKCDEELDNWYHGPAYGATMHGLTIGAGFDNPVSMDSYGLDVAGPWPTGVRTWLGSFGIDFDGDEYVTGSRVGSPGVVGSQKMIAEWWQEPTANIGYLEAVKLWSQTDSLSEAHNPLVGGAAANGQDISYWFGPRQSSNKYHVDGNFESALAFNPAWAKNGVALCGINAPAFFGKFNQGTACLSVDAWGNTNVSGTVTVGNGLVVSSGGVSLGGDLKLSGAFNGQNVTATRYQEALSTPSSSSAPCEAGQFTDDANYHYVCVSTNTWKRVALSSF